MPARKWTGGVRPSIVFSMIALLFWSLAPAQAGGAPATLPASQPSTAPSVKPDAGAEAPG